MNGPAACSEPIIPAMAVRREIGTLQNFSRAARSSGNSNNQLYLRDWIRKLNCIRIDFNNSSFLYRYSALQDEGLIEKRTN